MPRLTSEKRGYEPNFLAPTGPGRPRKRTNLKLPVQQFADSIDTFYDSVAIEGGCRVSKNMRCNEGRTLNRRRGYSKAQGSEGAAGKVYMLESLQQFNATDILCRLIDGAGAGVQLQETTDGSSWSDVGSNIGTASDRIDWFGTNCVIDNTEYLYFTDGVVDLRYTNGSTVSSVSGVRGKYITTLQNILVLGHLTTMYDKNQLVYSKAGSHQFYRDTDSGYSTSSNVITLDGRITQLVTLGWLVYIFTESDGLWELDLNTGIPRRISTHGTMSPKSVGVGHDVMIWADQSGIWGLPVQGDVVRLSDPVDGIYGNISASNVTDMVGAVGPNGFYRLWVGDVTYEGVNYSDVELVYNVEESRRRDKPVWRMDTGADVNCRANWTNANTFTNPYWGSQSTQTVYLDDTGHSDDGSDIETVWQSKDFKAVEEQQEMVAKGVYFWYQPDDSSSIDVRVDLRMDLGDWETQANLTLSSSTDNIAFARVEATKAMRGSTIGMRLTSSDNKALKIYETTLVYDTNETERHLS